MLGADLLDAVAARQRALFRKGAKFQIFNMVPGAVTLGSLVLSSSVVQWMPSGLPSRCAWGWGRRVALRCAGHCNTNSAQQLPPALTKRRRCFPSPGLSPEPVPSGH
eukprot:363694-Chlamydomonas_euryale.AAC.7